MRYNPAARESTVGNEIPMKLASVGNINQSVQSGYQPSAKLQQPRSINPTSESNQNLGGGRRRRAGEESPKEEITSIDRNKRVVSDPLANVDFTLKSNVGGTNVNASQAISQKPMTYEQKLNNEAASQPSFLDMIGGGGNSQASKPAPMNQPSTISQPRMMQASISRVAPSQVNASIASGMPS